MSDFEEIDSSEWPDSLLRLVEVIGTHATLKLVDHCGGTRHRYVPHKPNPTHPWSEVLGLETYQKLCNAFPGKYIDIPRLHFPQLKKKTILELWETGQYTKRAIALKVRCNENYVGSVVRQLGDAGLARNRKPSRAKRDSAAPTEPRQVELFKEA